MFYNQIEFTLYFKMVLKIIKENSFLCELLGVIILIMIKIGNYYILGKDYIMFKNNILENISNIVLTLIIINLIMSYKKVIVKENITYKN